MGKGEEGTRSSGELFERSKLKKSSSTPVLSSTEKTRDPLCEGITQSLPETCVTQTSPERDRDSKNDINGEIRYDTFTPDTNATNYTNGSYSTGQLCSDTNATNCTRGSYFTGQFCSDITTTSSTNVSGKVKYMPSCLSTNNTSTKSKQIQQERSKIEKVLKYARKVGPIAFIELGVSKFIIWEKDTRRFTLKRGRNGHLGVEICVLHRPSKNEYYVIITKVVERGTVIGDLKRCDRIKYVNGVPLTNKKAIDHFEQVYTHESKLEIIVCSPDSVEMSKLMTGYPPSFGSEDESLISYFGNLAYQQSSSHDTDIRGSSLESDACSTSSSEYSHDSITRLKCVFAERKPRNPSPKRNHTERSPKRISRKTYLHKLDNDIFIELCLNLSTDDTFGKNWKYLAGFVGKMTVTDVDIISCNRDRRYKAVKDCLLYLGRSKQLTIERLLEILENPMERLDVIHAIQQRIRLV